MAHLQDLLQKVLHRHNPLRDRTPPPALASSSSSASSASSASSSGGSTCRIAGALAADDEHVHAVVLALGEGVVQLGLLADIPARQVRGGGAERRIR